ncbi:MAG: class I SAM-dependent methyltransferase [Bacteroidetes bacterium]|nr:class I SAM-dependent methyltransferase [Bacteroidota bacterium]
MDSTKRFSDRVEDYVKYRPGYPDAVVSTLGVEPWMVVADIGSGTGISTEPFLRRGNKVYAVEPNADMRAKAEELLGGYAGFVSVGGTAERTGLPDGSVDLIVAGQAFHWFDPVRTRSEWVRVSRPGARAALIWNERLMVMPFEAEYEELILKYAGDYKTINHKNITGEQVGRFFAPEDYVLYQFENGQDFDFEGLKGRLLSSSYIPKEGARYEEMMKALGELFGKYAEGGMVRVRYDTKMYVGRIK